MRNNARLTIQRWVLVLSFTFGLPALLIAVFMPFLDISHATYLTATKDYPGAIAALNRAIAMNSFLSVAYVKRGFVYERLNEIAKALNDYDSAIRINGGDWSAYNNRAWLLTHNNDAAKALPDAMRAVQLCPDCAQAFDTRATVELALGDKQKALEDYDRAIELDPKFGAAYFHRSQCRDSLGQKPEAESDLDKAKEFGFIVPDALEALPTGQNGTK